MIETMSAHLIGLRIPSVGAPVGTSSSNTVNVSSVTHKARRGDKNLLKPITGF